MSQALVRSRCRAAAASTAVAGSQRDLASQGSNWEKFQSSKERLTAYWTASRCGLCVYCPAGADTGKLMEAGNDEFEASCSEQLDLLALAEQPQSHSLRVLTKAIKAGHGGGCTVLERVADALLAKLERHGTSDDQAGYVQDLFAALYACIDAHRPNPELVARTLDMVRCAGSRVCLLVLAPT